MSEVCDPNASFGWSLKCIDNEYAILSRLLCRNNNQHGKSLVFSHLKSMKRILSTLSSENCKKLINSIDAAVRHAGQPKQNKIQIDAILSTTESVYDALSVCLKCIFHASKASQCIIKLLSLKVFVPLYSLLLALVGRICRCISIICVQLDVRYQALRVQIKVCLQLLLSRFIVLLTLF